MQELTSVTYKTSEQHILEATRARQDKDIIDLNELLYFLESKNPFNPDNTTLRSIATGVTANNTVNAHKAKNVGQKILNSMEGKKVTEHSFKKKISCNT